MVTRKANGLRVLAVLAAWGCSRLSQDALEPGQRFPLGGEAAARFQVAWVVRPDDYLTCQNAAAGLREFQRETGGSVPLTVLYVGPHPVWLQEFLARQRIAATVVQIDENHFQRAFERRPGPWMYLLSRGVVRDVLPGVGYVRPITRWRGLIGASGARPDHAPAAAGAAEHSPAGD